MYRKESINLTLPVFLELLISSLFGVVDMIMVGNSGLVSVTTPAIAAIGITNQVMLVGIAIAQALSAGGTAIISRYCGAKRGDEIPNVVRHLIILVALFLILPFLLINQVFPESMMKFIGAEKDTITVGLKYFKVITFGFLFQGFNLAIFASMRGAGDTKTPMIINTSVNIVNVILNYILIFGKLGFKSYGVTGAGIATTISHVLASIVLVKLLLNDKHIVKLNFGKRFNFDKNIMYNLTKIGVPAAIEQAGFRIGVIFFIKIVSGLGTTVYATHQIVSNILSLSFAPGQAFGIAASTLVGRSLGENRIDKAELYVKEINKLAMGAALVYGFIFYFFGPVITGFYTKDTQIIKESIEVMRIVAIIQPFQASTFALAGGLRGAGDTVSTLIITLFGVVAVRIIVAYILINHFGLGLLGAWIAMMCDQTVRWIGITVRYKMGRWKDIKIR